MNQPPENLLAQLEQATAGDSTDDQLDDDTATLRESWLLLGRLIEAVDEESATLVPTSKPRSRPIRPWRVALAVAAALLVAFASWSMTWRQRSSDPTAEIAESTEVTNDGPSLGDSDRTTIGREDTVTPGASEAASEFAWDDAFDEELTKASVAIHSARSDWSDSEASYLSLSDRFAAFEQELEEGSL